MLVAAAVAAVAAVVVAVAVWPRGAGSTSVELDSAGTTTTAGMAAGTTSTTLAAASSAPSTTVPPATAAALATAPRSSVTPQPKVPQPPPPPPFQSSIAPVTAADVSDSYRSGCPVPPEQLRMVTVSTWGFDGVVRNGRVVVRDIYASAIVTVFHRLYDVRFPIERMQPVDQYGGNDDASMAANNTSAFNCRPVTGGTSFSEHAYGRAIDINPVQNPYVSGSTVLPPAGRAYANPNTQATGKIHAGDAVVQAFQSIGWFWGGAWSSPKDYQHFSSTNH